MGRFRKSVLKVLGFLVGNPDHPLCVSTCLFKAEAALKPPEHPTQPQASLHCSQVKAVGENGRSWDQLVPRPLLAPAFRSLQAGRPWLSTQVLEWYLCLSARPCVTQEETAPVDRENRRSSDRLGFGCRWKLRVGGLGHTADPQLAPARPSDPLPL